MEIQKENRITIESGGTKIYLDPTSVKRDGLNLISHAHTDHTPSRLEEGPTKVFCTSLTKEIIRKRSKGTINLVLEDPDSEEYPIKILPAGHTAGSLMFLITLEEKRILYTGDFCTYPRLFLKQAALPVDVDIILMEGTYGHPRYVFPPISRVLGRLADWINDVLSKNQNAVLLGYSFGKAQILCSFLEEQQIPYVVDSSVEIMNNAVQETSEFVSFSGVSSDSEEGQKLLASGGVAMVAPFAFRKGMSPQIQEHVASFSGWTVQFGTRRARGIDAAFPLSDHCDFPALVDFVRRCNPEEVFCFTGFRRDLSQFITEKLDIPSTPLGIKKERQLSLDDFFSKDG